MNAFKSISLLAAVMTVSALAAGGAMAAKLGDSAAYGASFLVAFLVWLVDAVAIGVIARAKSGPARINAILLGILLRMATPLVALIVLTNTQANSWLPGVVSLLLVHYLVGLVFGTFFSVRLIGSSPTPSAVQRLA